MLTKTADGSLGVRFSGSPQDACYGNSWQRRPAVLVSYLLRVSSNAPSPSRDRFLHHFHCRFNEGDPLGWWPMKWIECQLLVILGRWVIFHS